MKKTLILLLAALLALSMAGCGLGGKTLYLPEKVEVYSNGELSGTITYEYDKNGFLAKILTVSGDNTGTQTVICDENGNVLSAYPEQPAGATTLLGQLYAYTYSTRGNKLSETWTMNDEVQNQTNWEYNSKHQVTRAIHKDHQGNTIEYLHEYDKEGKLLAIHCLRDGEQTATTTFEYDGQGRLVLESFKNEREIEVYKVDYRYEAGKTVAEYYRKDVDATITYTFDHAGNLIEMIQSGGTIAYVYTYKEVKVSKDSPRKSYTGLQSLPATGLINLWQ